LCSFNSALHVVFHKKIYPWKVNLCKNVTRFLFSQSHRVYSVLYQMVILRTCGISQKIFSLSRWNISIVPTYCASEIFGIQNQQVSYIPLHTANWRFSNSKQHKVFFLKNYFFQLIASCTCTNICNSNTSWHFSINLDSGQMTDVLEHYSQVCYMWCGLIFLSFLKVIPQKFEKCDSLTRCAISSLMYISIIGVHVWRSRRY
jgi:hypothetical protein